MATVLILGAGMVGSTMAIDLSLRGDTDVVLADKRPDALRNAASKVKRIAARDVRTVTTDLSNATDVTRLASNSDIVVGALSSVIGFQTLRAVIAAKRNYVDISFMPENPLDLDSLARESGVTAVVDCGVAPGLSNLLAGHAASTFDPCERIEIYVGGLPRERTWPYQYKAAFSPADVIEEYTRPARLVEHGRTVVREALSEPELMNFAECPGVGTLEAFNTDGLRTLIDTLPNVPHMKEKTLRYPGHIELMRVLRETGLFSKEFIDVGGASVRPLDVASRLLFPKWTYEDGEVDVTVMRVIAHGRRAGAPCRMEWTLFDQYDPRQACTSMSRTTAYPATIMVDEVLSGRVNRRGVLPPEVLGSDEALVRRVLAGLEARGVSVKRSDGP
jgi:lysine 6-dehydrogenase